MYYNTTSESGTELKESEKKAKSQTQIILDYFKKINPGTKCTPSHLYKELFDSNTPITSVRRSLNTLTNQSVLEKTEDMAKGLYGKKEHFWILKTK